MGKNFWKSETLSLSLAHTHAYTGKLHLTVGGQQQFHLVHLRECGYGWSTVSLSPLAVFKSALFVQSQPKFAGLLPLYNERFNVLFAHFVPEQIILYFICIFPLYLLTNCIYIKWYLGTKLNLFCINEYPKWEREKLSGRWRHNVYLHFMRNSWRQPLLPWYLVRECSERWQPVR